jgi:Mn-dependent DtxR family transcriptional regulator
MSTAVNALILLRLDARKGLWVGVADLCNHLGITRPVVQQACAELADMGLIHHATHQGSLLYGVGVEGVQP